MTAGSTDAEKSAATSTLFEFIEAATAEGALFSTTGQDSAFNLVSFSSGAVVGNGVASISGGDAPVSVAPEPGAWALMLGGVGAIGPHVPSSPSLGCISDSLKDIHSLGKALCAVGLSRPLRLIDHSAAFWRRSSRAGCAPRRPGRGRPPVRGCVTEENSRDAALGSSAKMGVPVVERSTSLVGWSESRLQNGTRGFEQVRRRLFPAEVRVAEGYLHRERSRRDGLNAGRGGAPKNIEVVSRRLATLKNARLDASTAAVMAG